MGDRILKVNDTDVTGATHQEAVMELLRPCDEIKLTVQHDPLPIGFQVRLYSFFCFFFIFLKLLFFGTNFD
jgi:protein scribble